MWGAKLAPAAPIVYLSPASGSYFVLLFFAAELFLPVWALPAALALLIRVTSLSRTVRRT